MKTEIRKSMTLKRKMLVVLAIVVAGCALLGYGYKWSVDTTQATRRRAAMITEFGDLIENIRVGLLQGRRDEKDFLLRHELRYANQHAKGMKAVRAKLDGLRQHMSRMDEVADRALAGRMRGHLQQYRSEFKRLVEAWVAMGLDPKSGALGALRTAVHQVEATLRRYNEIEFQNSMLMMRRHEKDFIARGAKKYVTEMDAERTRFARLLDASALPENAKRGIAENMATYHRQFKRLVATNERVGEITASMRDAAHALERDLDAVTKIRQQALTTLQAWRSAQRARTNRVFAADLAVFAVLLLLVLVWTAHGILVQLGADPARLAQLAEAIADGNLNLDLETGSGRAGGVFAAMKRMRERLSGLIEQDIQPLVDAARAGDLSRRVALEGKNGFYEKLCAGNNQLLAVNEQVVQDLVRVLGALARGDLSETIESDYQGAFAELKHDANTTVARLRKVVEQDIQPILDAARSGDLSRRIDLQDQEGFFAGLSAGINELVEVSEQVVKDTARVFGALAQGKLDESIRTSYRGAFAQLKEDANATVAKLTEVMAEIRSAAAEVNHGSSEIAEGNASLSQRTEEQASNLEETAAGMEEMTSTVKQNADNAAQANQLAARARAQAEHGGQVVSEAVEAVEAISAASKKIADIIGVIDEIAFQTNLLALNASVEAARAGEQGRGFAVVASEVRNLAGRSATAAREIKELIEDSVEKVGEGKRLVDESGSSLDEIVGSVKKVTDVVSEIAAASNEQTEGIEQINQAVTRIDEMTQRNAALVEEAAAASAAMGQQARKLDELVSFFGTGEDTALTPPDTAPMLEVVAEPAASRAEGRVAVHPRSSHNARKTSLSSAPPPAKTAAAGGDGAWAEF